MKLKKKYMGLQVHRHSREPLEKAFSEAWQRLNDDSSRAGHPDALANLLHVGNQPSDVKEPSKRDHAVAATVIQWLGSPIGSEWVKSILTLERNIHDRLRRVRER